MKRLRSTIYWVALAFLLHALGCSSCSAAGTVSLAAWTEAVGEGSPGPYVCKGCDVKIVVYAYDCDEYDCTCCADDLTFPDWPLTEDPPSKAGGVYREEYVINVTWSGPQDFVFRADDQVACPAPYIEDDDPGEYTLTITGVEVDSIVVQNAPWLYPPNAPVCPCQEGGTVDLTAVTDPIGYEHLIPWSGGGVPETATGAVFRTYWTTPGLKTVRAGCGDDAQTMDIEVAEPFYDASFLDLTGPVGGTTAVKYQVRTRCVAHDMPHLETRHTASDPWTDDVIALGETCTTNLPDENGITTYMYPLLLWQTIDRVTDGNGVEHNLDKVGDYLLRGTTDMTPCTSQQTVADIQPAQVGVKNLTVKSTLPEGVVFWTGEEGTTIPIQVTIEDSDLSDPVALTLRLYNTGDDNRGTVWSPSATLQHDGIADPVHTFYWNGTPTGESYDTNYLPEGTYTFEVTATQADENLCLNCNGIPPEPGCTAGDKETYRSEYLKIVRASDESGNPIYDVEYEGIDNNNTPDNPEDDKYIYVIRKYVLKDSLGVNASAGVIWLYDPEGEMVHDWNIAEQDCIIHNARDGLHATADGLDHALRIRVPVEKMPYGGTYRFVLHIKDAHGGLYRNGENRWALDLNGEDKIPSFTVWMTDDPVSSGDYGEDIASRLEELGYEACWREGYPELGGTGRLLLKTPRLTIRTLNRLSPGDDPAGQKFLRWSAVWAYLGHGEMWAQGPGVPYNMSYLQFMVGAPYFTPPEVQMAGIWASYELAEKQRYSIDQFNLEPVRLAYLAACFSAGGSEWRNGSLLTVSQSNSVAAHFKSSGAKAVIGFSNRMHAHIYRGFGSRPTEIPYREFHLTFWEALRSGKTVGAAYKAAWDRLDEKNNGLNKRYPKSAVYPILRGDPNIKIIPPKYGSE